MYSKLHKITAGRGWILTQDWNTPYIKVPYGFWSDGVSVPWLFRWYIHRDGELLQAAILHDYLYNKAYKTKEFADESFYEAARHFKVNRVKAYLAYLAVKIFGKGNYK